MNFNPDLVRINSNPLTASYGANPENSAKAEDLLQEKLGRRVASATGVAAPGLQLGEKKSAEDVAKTMLEHVNRGLDSLRRQGASEERLMQRLEAAKEGIAKGYQEGIQQLDDMGLLNDDLETEIARGRELIDAGLKELEAGLSDTDQGETQAASSYQYAARTRIENSLTLDVLTRDGDKVSVSFAQVADRFQYQAQSAGSSIQTSGYEEGFAWQMDVNGSLDEEEQQALGNLLKDVEKLSNTFFRGDLGGALEQAMELGFDGTELASMSLNLKQSAFSSVSQAYNQVQPQLPTEQLESLKAPLLAYNEDYFAALDQAAVFAEPERLINELVDQLLPDEKLKDIFKAYNAGLQQAVDMRNSLLSDSGLS